MFSHIPKDVFSTQINGNMDEALKVLNLRTDSLKHKSRIFEWEFTSLDPENPITQVSKTPSDEFPCEWIDGEEEDGDEIRPPNDVSRTPRQDSKSTKLGIVDENEEKEEMDGNNEPSPGEREGAAADVAKKEETGTNENKGNEKQATNEVAKPGDLELKTEEETNAEEDKDKIPIKWIRSKRPASLMKTKLLVKDVMKFIDEMKQKITQEDLNLRVWPNVAACRFELPIDMTRLEGLTPLAYISQYCRVTDSRKAVYAAKYERYLPQKDNEFVLTSDLRNMYENIYKESGLVDEMLHLRRLLNLDLNEELDVELFTVISCLMERIIVKSKGLGTEQETRKNVFEEADFCSLNGKLCGVNISSYLRNLLEFIRKT